MLDRSRPIFCFLHDASSAESPEGLWSLSDDVWKEIDIVQVRGKALDDGAMQTLVGGWVERLADLETRVVVNDRFDLALTAEADGAHLGGEDLPLAQARETAPEGFLLGASCHSRDELLIAQAQGADYAGLGAFFQSETKPEAEHLDPWRGGLMERIPALRIPVLGIGGLTPERVDDAFRVPAVTGVAASAAVQKAEDPAAAIAAFRRAIDRAWNERVEVASR